MLFLLGMVVGRLPMDILVACGLGEIIIFVGSFIGGMLVFHSSWCAAGALIPRFVQSKQTLLYVNLVMVTLMVGATGYAMFS